MSLSEHPLYGAFYTLVGQARPDNRAKILVLTSPFSQVGTSYVARNLALLAAQYYGPQGRRVALIDFDLNQQSQAAYFNEAEPQARHGAVMGPYDITFGTKPFWQVSPGVVDANGNRMDAGAYGGAYMIGDSGLVISRFDWTMVKHGQQVHVRDVPEYWEALRDQFALIVVDTPAFDRLDTAMSVIPIADATALVGQPHQAKNAGVNDLFQKINSNGGYCAGLIVNAGVKSPETKPQMSSLENQT